MKHTSSVRLWDLPVRIFHWVLVCLVITSFVTAEMGGNFMQYHLWSGYTILVLLLFRLIWGFVGSTTARFITFISGPVAAWRYARKMMQPGPPHLGHNPLGGWSIVAMLAALLTQVITGLFATDDIATQGPLYPLVSDATSHWLTGIHLFNQGVIVTLVCLHIVAVLFYLIIKRDNLILPMITGWKPHADTVEPQERSFTPTWIAVIVAAICALAVYFLVK